VAIGAKDSKILETVVVTASVLVIKLQWNRGSVPLSLATRFALGLLQPGLDESPLQVRGLAEAAVDEKFFDRRRRHNWSPISPTPPLPLEVRRVDTHIAHSLAEVSLESPAGAVPKSPENLAERPRLLDRHADLVIGSPDLRFGSL
jgi:hypothetical protein